MKNCAISGWRRARRSLRRRRAAILWSERGWHHDRPVAGEQRALAKERCRSGTSFAGGEWQRSFADGFGRKEQRLADVVSLEVGVQREDALCGLAFCHEGNDSRNWNSKTAKTRNSPHLAGIGRDPLELHTEQSSPETADLWKSRAPAVVFVKPQCEVPSAYQTVRRCHSLLRRTNLRVSTRAADWRRRASALRIASSTASRSLPTSSARKRSAVLLEQLVLPSIANIRPELRRRDVDEQSYRQSVHQSTEIRSMLAIIRRSASSIRAISCDTFAWSRRRIASANPGRGCPSYNE